MSLDTPARRWGLVILAWLLLIWEPFTFAWLASAAFARLTRYGAPAIGLLVFRSLAVGVGMAAGRALLAGHSHGIPLAKASVVLSAIGSLCTYLTPYFPTFGAPGEVRFRLLITLAYYVAWYTYLWRAGRPHAA